MAEVRIFLSTVSAEFRSYRDALRHYLERPNVTAKVQEDFIATGSETLDMLDDYIRQCEVVIHLVGDMTGAMAPARSVAVIRQHYPDFGSRLPPVATFLETGGPLLSYTQWEAWLALYHGKRLIIAVPESGAQRDDRSALDPLQAAAQQEHLARLRSINRHPGIRFVSSDQFAAEVWRSSLLDILIEAGLVREPVSLPYTSLGDLFMGREPLLAALTIQFGPFPQGNDQAAVAKALTGLGGVGKTRLALEYAWRRGGYTAMLLVGADSAAALERNLADLCGAAILDLPAKGETDEGRQRDAVVTWLNQHPGWLLILDNVDTKPAASAVKTLLAKLLGGHVLITSRLANWSASVATVPVDLLAPDAAADFLLSRTAGKRRPQPDDPAAAQILAGELGYLALALEQAGAYIVQRRLSFGQYLSEWQRRRETALGWYDPALMEYPTSVAITWQSSFDQLKAPARRLLQRLAWLAPEPVPESLLDVPVAGDDPAAADPCGALAELESYSLVTRSADLPVFSVHRLVLEVTRRGQRDDSAHGPLVEALNWVNEAFVGDPLDVRNWAVLDPLAAHARAVAACADGVGIPDPTTRLLNYVGLLLNQKALYAEAEPLMRRALAIDEASFGTDHPRVATDLNNLALLLQATNRLAEAEPLLRRALAIDKASFGADHPSIAIRLNNLAVLLKATNRLAEAEPLMRRALAIDEASFGADHPDVARDLNNLAALLQATNRLAEAEPLLRRALAIDEASFGADHPRVTTDLNNLAAWLQATNRLAEAEPLMRRAMVIDGASLGADHPRVATEINNLAQLLQATNRLAEAEPLMRRVLTIDEASFGPDHPDVARDLNNLAQLLKATNRLAEAEPLLRRALAIDEASFGADHPDVARDLNNLAALLQATNRLAEAESLMCQALAICIKSLGADHPSSRIVMANYTGLLQAMGRTADEISAALASLIA
ncbi:MAG: tetratricopeptide repeat protein [Dechloromonas sp.]|nr:tetratricopeptide repeat protein [Dechloromonas sp.]